MSIITLDPDFKNYRITKVIDRDHFTFEYYEEPSQNLRDETRVACFEYSEIRGNFRASRVTGMSWEAVRE